MRNNAIQFFSIELFNLMLLMDKEKINDAYIFMLMHFSYEKWLTLLPEQSKGMADKTFRIFTFIMEKICLSVTIDKNHSLYISYVKKN